MLLSQGYILRITIIHPPNETNLLRTFRDNSLSWPRKMHKKGCSLWLNFLISSFSHQSFISRFFFYNHLLRISNWRIPRFVAKSSSRWRDEGGRFESLLSKPGVLEESLRGLLLKSKSIIPAERSKYAADSDFYNHNYTAKLPFHSANPPHTMQVVRNMLQNVKSSRGFWHQESPNPLFSTCMLIN